jgi:hypothetical protein
VAIVPNLATASLHSPPIEEVLFLRDEMANLAWAGTKSPASMREFQCLPLGEGLWHRFGAMQRHLAHPIIGAELSVIRPVTLPASAYAMTASIEHLVKCVGGFPQGLVGHGVTTRGIALFEEARQCAGAIVRKLRLSKDSNGLPE